MRTPRSRRYQKPQRYTLKERLAAEPAHFRDPFLRELQKRWDAIYFDQTYSRESNGTCHRDAKVDHIGDHIAKLLKKIKRATDDENDTAAYDTLASEATGDSAIYRTQLANTLSFNLQKHLGDTRTDSSDLQEAKDLVIEALPQNFTEPQEHSRFRDATAKREVREVGIPALHVAHLILANYCDVDPVQAHLDRLCDQPDIHGIS